MKMHNRYYLLLFSHYFCKAESEDARQILFIIFFLLEKYYLKKIYYYILFVQRQNLKMHNKSAHTTKEHQCKYCDYMTFSKVYLSIHNDKMHKKCLHCEYEAPKPSILKQHIDQVHLGIKRKRTKKKKLDFSNDESS